MKGYRFILLICGVTFLIFPSNIQAQEQYPSRRIELVVPYSPGGAADLLARVYCDKLAANLKTRIIVVNRPGGGGIQGTIYAAHAKKDGYTLLAEGGGAMVFNWFNKEAKNQPHPLNDFTPLGSLGYFPMVCSVRSDSPFKTFNELVEYAQKNPNKLKHAEGGGISPSYLNIELMRAKNIQITVIPFSSGAESTTALLGGHVDMTFNSLMTAGPLVKAGKLRPLAITSKKRFPPFADIPTTTELGYPYVDVTAFAGTLAPSGCPQSVLTVLNRGVEKTFKDPDIMKALSAINVIPEYHGPEEYRKMIESAMNAVGKALTL